MSSPKRKTEEVIVPTAKAQKMDDYPAFIMFFSTEYDKHKLAALLEKTHPGKYQDIDRCGTRVAYQMTEFPEFVTDVKKCAKKLKYELKRLMAIPDPGLGLCMDFPEDMAIGSQPDALNRCSTWDSVPHHLRPSSYVNYV